MRRGSEVFRRNLAQMVHPKKPFLGKKYDIHHLQMPSAERPKNIAKLQESLVKGNDIIYRGTEGMVEVEAAIKDGHIGRSLQQSRKAESLDLVAYIRDNNSKCFISASPCAQTAGPYAAGLSLIPCVGIIWVTGLPKVYTLPQKLLHLNRKLFVNYDHKMINQQDLDDTRRYDSIIGMTENNNELTVIVGARAGDDWRQNLEEDVMKVVKVSGPGRFLGKFMSSQELLHVDECVNSDFKKRVWSIEIVLSDGQNYSDDLKEMSTKAQELGLIPKGFRLLTIEDAVAIVNSGKLDELNDRYSIQETHRLMKVPSKIEIGDTESLADYMKHEIESMNDLMEVERGSNLDLKF